MPRWVMVAVNNKEALRGIFKGISDISGEYMPSYYINLDDKFKIMDNCNIYDFGEGKRSDELLLDYNLPNMIGVHDFSVQHTWPPTPPSGGDTGGGTTNPPSGGNTGGGTTNPPSGGSTGGGTTNPPSGGNTGGGTTNPLPNPNPGGNRPTIPNTFPNNPLIKEIAEHYRMSEADLLYIINHMFDKEQRERMEINVLQQMM